MQGTRAPAAGRSGPLAPPPPAPPGAAAGGRLRALARLAKFEFVLDYYLSALVVLTALAPGDRLSADTWLTLALFVLGQVGVVSAVMVFDDINGYRDGSDQANYLGGDGTPLRPLERKPLLTGALTLRQAYAFGYGALAWGAVFWGTAALLAAHRPFWALAVTGAVLLTSCQYSWGLKFSYRGLGELLIAGCPMALVIAQYGFTAGHLPALVLVEATLFGLWQILVSAYSNTKDIDGDRAVGRSTVAVRTSETGNRRFIGALTGADLLLGLGGAALLGWAPWWSVLALLPLAALRIRQYRDFLRDGDALLARARGVRAFRTGVAGLLLVNIIHFTV
ncbi:UbiA family prenyltransferase [Streptomyces sp. NPDC097619]|uniref:UbiA family prenyltransferase n=1 Tax=Streptomyces sp. NPDC097619 TaxID=3157228 RepID=UPI00331AA554